MPIYSERNEALFVKKLPDLVPTVFVGLGGSGKSVLMRLRKRLHDRFPGLGDRFDHFARFVFIDTDRGGFTPKGEKEEMYADVMPGESELVEVPITRHQFETVFNKLELRAEAEKYYWLKPSMRRVGPGAVENGAGTHRQFGRLAFFENFESIQKKLEDQIKGVLKRDANPVGQDVVKIANDRIEVVIVTSMAGGTGSGMFLDVAYLARHLLSKTSDELKAKHVTLIAFLPEIFHETVPMQMPKLRRNAYAALLELEHYGTPMTGDALFLGEEVQGGRDGRHGFQATWPGKTEFFPDRGWDTLFLVDNVNSLTQSSPLTDSQVFQMTADYLFLEFGQSRFAEEKRTARSNLVMYKDRRKVTWVQRERIAALDPERATVFATQTGCIYSTFGLAEIFFDRENLYQAAAYRLANRLVQLRWLGTGRDVDDDVSNEWADADLIRPTRSTGETEAPVSFHPKAVARRAAEGRERNWLDAWAADLAKLDGRAEDEGAEKLAEIADRHRRALAPGGESQRTIAQNAENWAGDARALGEWRGRLQQLVDRRLSDHGVAPTRKLLEAYKRTLDDVGKHLANSPAGDLGGSLLSRLAEARTVPFPARQIAVRIELAKARKRADSEVTRQYVHVAGRELKVALASAVRFVGDRTRSERDGVVEPLHLWLDRAEEQLSRIANRLEERFKVASRGRDRDHRKQSLTVSWDEEQYDRKINQALLISDKVGRAPDRAEGPPRPAGEASFNFDWPKLERLVLKEFGRGEANETPTDSIASLLRYWEKQNMVSSERIDQIARRLAEACETVLEKGLQLDDYEDGNVADLLQNTRSKNERENMAEQLVDFTAPYLPLTHSPGEPIQPAYHNLFGLSEGARATSRENARAVTTLVQDTASKRQAGDVAKFNPRLEIEESTALAVRMAAGFPLQDYSRLEDLYNAYRDSASTVTGSSDECHLDFRQSWEDLPDVRPVKPETYALIRDHVEIVLLNMMTGVITHPPGREAFYVRIPDPYGAGEDYHRLGKRISRAIMHACDEPSIRKHLVDQWTSWSRQAGVKEWACLYESALRSLNESRPEIAVDAGREVKAPFRNCHGELFAMIGKRLGEIEGGRAWLDALRPRNDGDVFGREDDRPATAQPTGLDAALRPIREGLKIYQLVPAKVRLVELADADPAAPTA